MEDSNVEFNTILFEKRLSGLKDSQDSINACGQWCLQNRHHHKNIVSCWLNVLKRVKLEQRVTLFYLANEVIQYSKRRNYDFVESWGTTLQKATTLVRDEKVKNKILRIFKIWEQRGVYDEEFLADLCGLISASPTARKGDETHEFQPAYLIQKVKACCALETDTDNKLKLLKEHNPRVQIDIDQLIASLKDRAHVDDVEKEIEEYCKQIELYVNALKVEIKARIHLVSLLSQADQQLEHDKRDVHVVTNAYKSFATRVKALNKKLEEKMLTICSPIPSPDVNAPSPSLDSDEASNNATPVQKLPSDPSSLLFTNPGYYNPVPPPPVDFLANNFSSFMDSSNLPFNLQKMNSSSVFETNNSTSGQNQRPNINDEISELFPSMICPPPPPATAAPESYQFEQSNPHVPLMPPPMPPFNKAGENYYSDSYNGNNNSNYSTPYEAYEPTAISYQQTAPPPFLPPPTAAPTFNSYAPLLNTSTAPSFQPLGMPYSTEPTPVLAPPYPAVEEYNPEEEVETWDSEATWEQPPIELETPESPPNFEKRGYNEPVEYHDGNVYNNAVDVDQRVLHINDGKAHRNKDVDHRNLISLTGSPNGGKEKRAWSNKGDQDYRLPVKEEVRQADQDYRVPFTIENFKLPPPPPPPNMLPNQSSDSNFANHHLPNFDATQKPPPSKRLGVSPKKLQDNNESIDMDLSDDEQPIDDSHNDGLGMLQNLPSIIDDLDANVFLDDVNQDVDMGSFDSHDVDHCFPRGGLLGRGPPFPPQFRNPQNVGPQYDWLGPSGFNNSEYQNRESFRGRGGNNRGNFNNRGAPRQRGNWNGPNDFRGRGRGRGGRGGENRIRGGRMFPGRGGRGDFRGRGNFRGNFRGGL